MCFGGKDACETHKRKTLTCRLDIIIIWRCAEHVSSKFVILWTNDSTASDILAVTLASISFKAANSASADLVWFPSINASLSAITCAMDTWGRWAGISVGLSTLILLLAVLDSIARTRRVAVWNSLKNYYCGSTRPLASLTSASIRLIKILSINESNSKSNQTSYGIS